MTVLTVDDVETNRKLLRVTLEAEGMKVFDASDGLEALEVLDREPVDAIISDILMPRMDGYRLCYEVRDSKRFCHVPFIFYTNTYTSPSDEKTGLDLGADRFLRKPSPTSEILAALHALTETARRAPTERIPPPLLDLMKEYSEALVRKLEEKNSTLQLSGEQLLEANEVLCSQTRELERAREELLNTNVELEVRVRERTSQLQKANQELEAFSHSAAHDLRAPLRAVGCYSQMLLEDGGTRLSFEGQHCVQEILERVRRMTELIEHLLKLSSISRCETKQQPVDLSELALAILQELQQAQPERQVEINVAPSVVVRGDEPLLRIALENLLNNAWKFTGKEERSRIEFGIKEEEDQPACFVRDNGAGFDMSSAAKLFQPFQRLHSNSEFQGIGIGLATVQRIILRHGGVIWAESAKNQGTTFYFRI